MERDNLEIALIKYNKKSWCKSVVLGFFIGLAVIVPGISGSTVAIIFRLYDQFLYAISNLFKQFKRCFIFLFPMGIGAIIGLILGFIGVKELVELLPFAFVCLFAGLMTGAFPAVYDEVKEGAWTPKRIALFAIGVFIPIAIGCISAWLTVGLPDGSAGLQKFAEIDASHILLAVLFGFVVGLTQIVPGLSASAFLMAVGWFQALLQSVSLTYWKSNPAVLGIYFALVVGFALGVIAFSKVLTYYFSKARRTAYSMIVGLSLGSILSMFCNGDIIMTYIGWANGGVWIWDVILGFVLFALGIVGAYALVKYQRKQDAKEQASKIEE